MRRTARHALGERYADLKAYQRDPEPSRAPLLAARFDAIFTQRTGLETHNQTLNETLKRLHAHRQKVLLVPSGPRSRYTPMMP